MSSKRMFCINCGGEAVKPKIVEGDKCFLYWPCECKKLSDIEIDSTRREIIRNIFEAVGVE